MNNKRIQEIIDVYLPEEEYSDVVRNMAKIACENVERELRSQISEMAFNFANSVSRQNKED